MLVPRRTRPGRFISRKALKVRVPPTLPSPVPGTDGPALAVPGGWALPLLLGVGVTATAGQLFLTKAFVAGPPAGIAVVGLSQVVFAMALDVLLWGRSFGLGVLLGTALVLASAAWAVARHHGKGPGRGKEAEGPPTPPATNGLTADVPQVAAGERQG